jgi:hypothetical protein
MAHAAGVGHALVELRGLGQLNLVRNAVAYAARGSGLVAALECLAVNTGGVFTGYIGMTFLALWFGYARGVRKRLVLDVTGRAPHAGVNRCLYLLRFVDVARCACFSGSFSGLLRKAV